jgi:hypothetical protein
VAQSLPSECKKHHTLRDNDNHELLYSVDAIKTVLDSLQAQSSQVGPTADSENRAIGINAECAALHLLTTMMFTRILPLSNFSYK